jgi:tRNA pseudouridine55 synthase
MILCEFFLNTKTMNGIYLINKPKGITSHDVVDQVRKITGERRVGHAGTLDPLASGLMIVAVGREFTAQLSNYVGLDKEYEAKIELGKTSTTYDAEGEQTVIPHQEPSLKAVEKALEALEGAYEQTPPIYSAKKIGGRKAYEMARKGEEVVMTPKLITVHKIELLDYTYPIIKIRVHVSSGTYIRSLAHDLGQELQTGAMLVALIRTKVGQYSITDS